MTFLANLAVRRPVTLLGCVAVAAMVAGAVGFRTPHLLGRASNDFVAKGSESLRAEDAIEQASGLSAAPQLLVLVRRPTPARLARVDALIRTEPGFPRLATLFSRDREEAIVAAYARARVSQRAWREAAVRVQRRLAVVPGTWVGGTALATK